MIVSNDLPTATSKKLDIRTLSLPAVVDHVSAMGEPAFRGRQIYEWLWKKSATTFSEMSNLSKKFQETLSNTFEIRPVTVRETQKSQDGTLKNSFALFDANVIEGVVIPVSDRVTACVSSQVGCSLSCKFCATGFMDRKRNLTAGEIYDQVVLMNQQSIAHFQQPLSNIVFMGMGEPLLNYSQVLSAIQKITGEEGLNMASKRITVSTAGISKMMIKLADDGVKFNLALSLHAANDVKRNEIMPINEQNSLASLREALKYFCAKTGGEITLEYIILDGFNDTLDDAREMLAFSKDIPCKVNLIEYNPIDGALYKNAREDKIQQFADCLKKGGMITHVRKSRGKDIDAACGQLAIKDGPRKSA